MAKNIIKKQEVKTEEQEVKTEVKTNEQEVKTEAYNGKIRFVHADGTDELIDFDSVPEMEKKEQNLDFQMYVATHDFSTVCKNPVWNMPYIGKHENGYLTFFYTEKKVNFKKFLSVKYSKDELAEMTKANKSELIACNSFLLNIASGDGIKDVSTIKEKLNLINDCTMHIDLHCVDDNDNDYRLTVTNKMVRILLVDKAKANKGITGFKGVKIIDMLTVLMEGLSKTYIDRTAKNN